MVLLAVIPSEKAINWIFTLAAASLCYFTVINFLKNFLAILGPVILYLLNSLAISCRYNISLLLCYRLNHLDTCNSFLRQGFKTHH